jgi:hypothetical protein
MTLARIALGHNNNKKEARDEKHARAIFKCNSRAKNWFGFLKFFQIELRN